MPTSTQNSHQKSSDNFLKTTTWGALIAISLVLAVFGLTGQISNSRGKAEATLGSGNISTTQTQAPAQGATSSSSDSLPGSPMQSAAQPNSFSPSTNFNFSVPPSSTSDTAKTLSASNFARPGVAVPVQPESTSTLPAPDSDDAQALIAAKIAPDLNGIDPEKPIDVIVQFKDSPNGSELSAADATAKSDLPLVHSQLVNVKGGNLSSLASNPNVFYVSPDRQVRTTAMNPAVTAVNADLASNSGWDGSGIGIAVIDSGITSVADLASDGNTNPFRVVYRQSFVPFDSNTNDEFGHGTHVASIAAGNGYASVSLGTYPDFYRGIAPQARVINLRVLDSLGVGTDSTV